MWFGEEIAKHREKLRALGVKLIINATRSLPNYHPLAFTYHRISIALYTRAEMHRAIRTYRHPLAHEYRSSDLDSAFTFSVVVVCRPRFPVAV